MSYEVTFTTDTLCDGAIRSAGSMLTVSDETARMLVDLGAATASGLTPQTGSAAAQFSNTFASKASNLSDLTSSSAARAALGLGTAATQDSADFVSASSGLLRANNLSDISDASASRTNLGLGVAATANYAEGNQVKRGIQSTGIVTPQTLMDAMLNGNVFRVYGTYAGATNGTGYSLSMSNTYGSISGGANSAGFSRFQVLNAQYAVGFGASFMRWQTAGGFGLLFTGQNSGVSAGSAVMRIGTGDFQPQSGVVFSGPTTKYVGFNYYLSSGNLELVVHDGSQMTTVPMLYGNPSGSTIRVTATWDGYGNVRAVVNNTIVVTTSAGPSGDGTLINPYFIHQLSSDGTNAVAISTYTFHPVLFYGDSQ